MSELDCLLAEFNEQPVHLRRKDLVRINELRQAQGLTELGMDLKPLVVEEEIDLEPPVTNEPKEPEPEVDVFQEQREILERFFQRKEDLADAQGYCDEIMLATQKTNGRTPVRPLATMGNDGGQLICDYCKKGFLLEGGAFNDIEVAEAWDLATNRGEVLGEKSLDTWVSWIRNHITFMVETNGTLRVYHGEASMGRTYGCGKLAEEADARKRQEFKKEDYGKFKRLMLPFITKELNYGDKPASDLVRDIYFTLYNYDPGLGVNKG